MHPTRRGVRGHTECKTLLLDEVLHEAKSSLKLAFEGGEDSFTRVSRAMHFYGILLHTSSLERGSSTEALSSTHSSRERLAGMLFSANHGMAHCERLFSGFQDKYNVAIAHVALAEEYCVKALYWASEAKLRKEKAQANLHRAVIQARLTELEYGQPGILLNKGFFRRLDQVRDFLRQAIKESSPHDSDLTWAAWGRKWEKTLDEIRNLALEDLSIGKTKARFRS